jgi:hypothetical protein
MNLPQQLQFQGSAESKGFNPITPASPTKALEADAARLSQSWEDSAGKSLAQQQRLIEYNNQQTTYNVQALAVFSQTLGKQLEEEQNTRNQAQLEEGMALAYEQGVPVEEQASHDSQEQELIAAKEGVNTYADTVAKAGAQVETVEAVRNLSGWKQYGYAVGLARQAAGGYSSWVQDKFLTDNETVINIKGEDPFTPATASTPTQKAAALAALRTQYFRQTGILGLNKALLNKYAWDDMRQVDQQYMDQAHTAYRKGIQDEGQSHALSDLATNIAQSPDSYGLAIKELMRYGLGAKEARAQATKTILEMQSTGEINAAQVTAAENSPSFDGKNTWGQLFKNEWTSAKLEMRKNQQALYQMDKAEEDRIFTQKNDQLMEELYKNPGQYDAKDIQGLIDKSREQNSGKVDPRLTDYLENQTLQARTNKQQTQTLDDLFDRGRLTTDELRSGKYSPEVVSKFQEKAKAQDTLRATPAAKAQQAAAKEAVKNAIQTKLQISGAGQTRNYTAPLAEAAAISQIDRIANQLIISGIPADRAYSEASASVSKMITDGTGIYATNNKVGPELGFKSFMGSGVDIAKANQRIQSIESQVMGGGAAVVQQRKLMTEAEAREALNPNNPIPGIVSLIRDRTGGKMSEFDVIDAQLKLYGLPPRLRPYAQIQADKLPPNLQQLLNSKPSPNRTARAFYEAGDYPVQVRKDNQGAKDIIQLAIAGGMPPAIAPLAAAQWAEESGWGHAHSGRNNVFGIKGPGTVRSTQEDGANGMYTTRASFRDYNSPVDSAKDYVKLISGGRYAAVFQARTPREAAQAVKDAGYATNKKYVSNLVSIMKQMGIDPDQPFNPAPLIQGGSHYRTQASMSPAAVKQLTKYLASQKGAK